jgi:hypothetical protein
MQKRVGKVGSVTAQGDVLRREDGFTKKGFADVAGIARR